MCFAPFELRTHRTAAQLPPQKATAIRGEEGIIVERLVKRAAVDMEVH